MDWRFLHEMDVPDEGHRAGFHVSNLAIARVLFVTRNRYFESLPIEGGIWSTPIRPFVREILLRYDSEVMSDARLVGALAVTSRSRRSFMMEESIMNISDRAAPRLVASGHSVHVTVDAVARTAVPIPDWFLAVLETFQGGSIPWRR